MRMDFASGGKMKTKYWFLIGIILVCVYAVIMLDWQADVATTNLQHEKMGGKPPALTDGVPAKGRQGAPPIGFFSRQKQDTSEPSLETAKDVTERKELTSSGVTIGDPEVLDPEEVEKRILAEQLAESLRNPAHLRATVDANSEDTEDTIEDTADDTEMENSDELADDQSEQEPDEEIALSDEEIDESALESDQSFTRPQMTASGVEISEHGYPDPEEVEKRLLAEQLAESLRNPAYQQSNPEEELLEEIEEEE